MEKSSLGELFLTESPMIYSFKEVLMPRGHFDHYGVMVSDEIGLCVVRVVTDRISSNRFGQDLRSRHDAIRNTLKERYGEGTAYNFLQPGSLWDEPQDFMMGLLRGSLIAGFLDGRRGSSPAPWIVRHHVAGGGTKQISKGLILAVRVRECREVPC